MAQFPYLLQGGFETGATDFDTAISDSDSKSSYPHYTVTAQKYGFTPWRGAYCWVIDQSIGSVGTACVQTQAAFNVADTNYWSVGFAFRASGTVMADGDRTTIFEADSGTTTNEATLQLYYTTAGGLQLLLCELNNTTVGANPVAQLTENQWHWIELYGINGTSAGTAYLVLDGVLVGGITSVAQSAFTDCYIGLSVIDATHTAGLYAFDDITICGLATTGQVRVGYRSRYPMNIHVSSRSNALDAAGYGEHLFIGPGTVREVSILTATAGDTIRLYDTDRAYTVGSYGLVAECNYSSGSSFTYGPIEFSRGCYCVVIPGDTSGARGIVNIDPAPEDGYAKAIYYGFPDNLKRYAITTRRELAGNR